MHHLTIIHTLKIVTEKKYIRTDTVTVHTFFCGFHWCIGKWQVILIRLNVYLTMMIIYSTHKNILQILCTLLLQMTHHEVTPDVHEATAQDSPHFLVCTSCIW